MYGVNKIRRWTCLTPCLFWSAYYISAGQSCNTIPYHTCLSWSSYYISAGQGSPGPPARLMALLIMVKNCSPTLHLKYLPPSAGACLGIKGNRDRPGFKRDLIPAQSTFKRVAILSSVIRLLRIGAHPARGLFTYCREVGGVPDGRPQRYTSDISYHPTTPLVNLMFLFCLMIQCFCILSRTCVWASRLWMVFTVLCNLHPGGEHFALWWIQLQNTFLHFWHFSFVASLYLRGCVRVTVVVFLHPDSARPPRLCLCILTLQILCSCYWTHRGCVFASCLSLCILTLQISVFVNTPHLATLMNSTERVQLCWS